MQMWLVVVFYVLFHKCQLKVCNLIVDEHFHHFILELQTKSSYCSHFVGVPMSEIELEKVYLVLASGSWCTLVLAHFLSSCY